MSCNCLLANLLSSMKNARSTKIKNPSTIVRSTKFLDSIIDKLKENRIVHSVETIDPLKNIKKINLIKFSLDPQLKPIDMVNIISTPGKRVYMNVDEIKKSPSLRDMRLVFLSTSFGVLEKKEALVKNTGGEILFGIRY